MTKRVNTAVWLEKYNRWQIKVQKDGRRRTFTSSEKGRQGQRIANAKADVWLDDGIDSGRLRMAQLCDDYVDEIRERTSQSHWRVEQSRMNTWIKPAIGHLKPESVTEQHCQDILNTAYTKGRSRKTIMTIRASISALFKYCRKRRACKFFPENLVIPRGATFKPKVILQPKDFAILFSVDTTMRNGSLVVDPYINFYRFAVVTGYRPGEILGFKPSDYDGTILKVARSINVYGEVTAGKNDNARRSQVLTPIAKAIWEKQLRQMTGRYVFSAVQEETILRNWHKYCKVNGISKTTLYELRHTYVSAIQSLPEAYIKSLVGHSKSMDTNVYIHNMDDTQKKIADAVHQVFSSILQGV